MTRRSKLNAGKGEERVASAFVFSRLAEILAVTFSLPVHVSLASCDFVVRFDSIGWL